MYSNAELRQLLASMEPAEQATWIEANADKISADNLEYLRTSDQAPPLSEISKSLLSDLWDTKVGDPEQSRFDRAESNVVAENPELDADGDGQIDDENVRAGLEADPAREQAEIQFYRDWGRPYDAIDLRRAAEASGQQFDSVEDLVNSAWYEDEAGKADRFATSILADLPPATQYRFKFNGETVEVPYNWVEKAANTFGFDTDEEGSIAGIENVIRHAAGYGITTAAGEVAWQPVAALWKIAGADDNSLADYRARSAALLRERAELERRIRKGQEGGLNPAEEAGIGHAQRRLQEVLNELRELREGTRDQFIDRGALMRNFQSGFKQYGNEVLGMFHALNPDLAARVAANPDEISEQDFVMIGSLLAKGGMSGEDLESLPDALAQIGWADPMMRKLYQQQQEALAGGGGVTRMKPDPVALRQSAKDFYRQMFMEEPDDATLDQFTASVSAAISSAGDDQQVDVEARIRQVAEGMPAYDKYYGNKPGGLTEMQYQGMHLNAQQEMLGAELANNQPAKVGMMQGDYQTTIGATMGTSEAWDNSTFLGRLARAAQTVARNT